MKIKIQIPVLIAFLSLASSAYGLSLISTQEEVDRYSLELCHLSPECERARRTFHGFSWNSFEEPNARSKLTIGLYTLSMRDSPSLAPTIGTTEFPTYHTQTSLMGSQGFDPPLGESFFSFIEGQWKPNSWFFSKLSVYGGLAAYNVRPSNPGWYHLQKAYAELRFRKLILSVGRKPMYWGQSFVGPLFLSENATSLDSVQISTTPLQWPSIFKYLGYLKAEVFYSILNDDRAPHHDHMTGLRVGVMPHPHFEFNVGFLYQLAGKGIPSAPITHILIELLGGRRNFGDLPHQSSNVTNRFAAIDFRLRFPDWTIPTVFYSEHHLEDCCGSIRYILRKSYSFLYGTQILLNKTSESTLNLEYVRTSNAIYYHQTWPSGFSNDGRIMGHPIGRDGRGLYAQLKHLWSKSFSSSILGAWERRERSAQMDGVPMTAYRPWYAGDEDRYSLSTHLKYKSSLSLIYEAAGGYSRILTKENYFGRDTNEFSVLLGATKTF